MPETHQSWNNAKLKQLKVCRELNGMTYEKLAAERVDEHKLFLNAQVRCTVLSKYKSHEVLYDTFYRLNSGLVPLNTQELRQVLNKGDFANYLMEITHQLQPLHQVLGFKEPDGRLLDIEIILRFIALVMFGQQDYQGHLKMFLDKSMAKITQGWQHYEEQVKQHYQSFNEAIERLSNILPVQKIGRLLKGEKLSRFNKVLFEVQVYYFMYLNDEDITEQTKEKFLFSFEALCNDSAFRATLESSTQTLVRYRTRFELFRAVINTAFRKEINHIPIKGSHKKIVTKKLPR